ncbi:hypothetical protein BKI52_00560 [marine bacterium AO1-C]|nr:hypothetical protein BKI52_00560 [marine bacterium AO1-C]
MWMGTSDGGEYILTNFKKDHSFTWGSFQDHGISEHTKFFDIKGQWSIKGDSLLLLSGNESFSVFIDQAHLPKLRLKGYTKKSGKRTFVLLPVKNKSQPLSEKDLLGKSFDMIADFSNTHIKSSSYYFLDSVNLFNVLVDSDEWHQTRKKSSFALKSITPKKARLGRWKLISHHENYFLQLHEYQSFDGLLLRATKFAKEKITFEAVIAKRNDTMDIFSPKNLEWSKLYLKPRKPLNKATLAKRQRALQGRWVRREAENPYIEIIPQFKEVNGTLESVPFFDKEAIDLMGK